MNCPKCGSPAATDQKFCRVCGVEVATGLERVADTDAASYGAFSRLPRATFGFMMILVGMGVFSAGGMLTKNTAVMFAGVVMILVGMAAIGYVANVPRRRKRLPLAAADSPAEPDEEMFRAKTTRQLVSPVESEGFGSVTEGTTDLLKVEKGRMKDDE